MHARRSQNIKTTGAKSWERVCVCVGNNEGACLEMHGIARA